MKNRIQIIIRYPGFFPAITTLLFAFAIFTGVLPISKPTQGIDWVAVLAKALLALAFLVLAWWFLHAFTHADQDASDKACQAEQTASMFRFAYMFAVYSFALLLLPFTAMLRTHETTPDAGPIRLLRACVVEQQAQPAARSASAGATPVSSTPMTTPAPAVSVPPVFAQTPSSPESPRKSVD